MSDAEHLDRAIERLLADQSPRQEASFLDDEELAMLRMAELLHGSRAEPPDELTMARLRDRVFPGAGKVSRRAAFLSGLGAMAAGVLGGIGLEHFSRGGPSGASSMPLVNRRGHWVPVTTLADIADGSVRAFDTGALQGYLFRRGDRVRALSRICTHMGCRLNFDANDQGLVCPCHGAEFDLRGQLRYGPYKQGQLPPLPAISVRVNGEAVEVWTA